MPIYEYSCEECGHTFQSVATIAAHKRGGVNCPRCSKTLVTLRFPDYHGCEGRLVLGGFSLEIPMEVARTS
jgi:putative FmdB family regulatory protein